MNWRTQNIFCEIIFTSTRPTITTGDVANLHSLVESIKQKWKMQEGSANFENLKMPDAILDAFKRIFSLQNVKSEGESISNVINLWASLIEQVGGSRGFFSVGGKQQFDKFRGTRELTFIIINPSVGRGGKFSRSFRVGTFCFPFKGTGNIYDY